jgi:hypothetical protein
MNLNNDFTLPRLNLRSTIAITLLLLCAFGAFAVNRSVGAKANFYQAKVNIPAGSTFTLNNVTVHSLVRAGLTPTYLQAGMSILGKVAVNNLSANQLIAGSDISQSTGNPFEIISLSAPRGNFPSNLQVGDRVDLYSLPNPNEPGNNNTSAKRLLHGATLYGIDNQSANLGGDLDFSLKVSSSDLTDFFTNISNKLLEVVADED